jgi:hypothetical protein
MISRQRNLTVRATKRQSGDARHVPKLFEQDFPLKIQKMN